MKETIETSAADNYTLLEVHNIYNRNLGLVENKQKASPALSRLGKEHINVYSIIHLSHKNENVQTIITHKHTNCLICSCLTKYNSFMFRKQIVIIGVTALVSLVTGSSLSVTRFDDHDGAIERSLQGDNKCKVAVRAIIEKRLLYSAAIPMSITFTYNSFCGNAYRLTQLVSFCFSQVKTRCTIGNTKANCEGHLKAKKKWCAKKANGKRRRIPVTLMLKWEACNMNENNVLPDADKTHARYNSWEKKINFRQKYLPAEKCLYLQSKKKFNLCSRGFTMSMQYAGKQINKGSKNNYCYAYEYKKIKKEWIKDKNEAAITVSPSLELPPIACFCHIFLYPLLMCPPLYRQK